MDDPCFPPPSACPARQENPFDPSHAPYLHDRTLRMRREDAIPMNMSLPVGGCRLILIDCWVG